MTSNTTSFAEELIESSRQAWREVSAAKAAANRADEVIKTYLVGRSIRITGMAASISGGTIHRDHKKHLRSELVTVTAVFYYYNEQYRNHEDTFRVRAGDGSEYELTLSTTKIEEPAEEQQ